MSQSLTDIAQQLRDSDKKTHLIYAFNGTGKTRLSRIFKELVAPKTENGEDPRAKILYYSAFTEDLFYWDNDLKEDFEPKLVIQPNAFTRWVLEEQGHDQNIIRDFQHYSNNKLTPHFNQTYETTDDSGEKRLVPAFSEVTFSLERGDNTQSGNLKISKAEESNFIWSVFNSLLEQVISTLNIPELTDRDTDQFNQLEYIFIDDPVSSLDENHLIDLAINLAAQVKSSHFDARKGEGVKFIITTHNPLFFNILFNELRSAKKQLLTKHEDGTFELIDQNTDSPFSSHLAFKKQLETAVDTGNIQRHHFNGLRNILEKTATFVGYEQWGSLLPSTDDHRENPYARIINLYSHSKHSGDDSIQVTDNHKRVLVFLVEKLKQMYQLKMSNDREAD